MAHVCADSEAAGSRIKLFGFDFDVESAARVLEAASRMQGVRPRQIVTANVDHIVTLAEDEAFRAAYGNAAARTLDGAPLVVLSRLRGEPRARRVTGHDLIAAALSSATIGRERVFMVCASPQAGRAMTDRFAGCGVPRTSLAFRVPPFGFEHDEALGQELAAGIRAHDTTLLIMGVGSPKSEVWVHRQGVALGHPVVLNVGEALNVAAGLVARAPLWVQKLGLEWLFRFGTDPRRLFRRYFIRSWRFLALAARHPDLARPPGASARSRV